MKQSIIALTLALVAGASFARAAHAPDAAASGAVATAGATEPGTPQRVKMKTCNADARAKDLHGADRKAMQSTGRAIAAAPAAAAPGRMPARRPIARGAACAIGPGPLDAKNDRRRRAAEAPR
jgi:hypothetical protein